MAYRFCRPVTLRIIRQPPPPACRCHWCERPAVLVSQWQTYDMIAPSFSSACLAHCHRMIGNPGVEREG